MRIKFKLSVDFYGTFLHKVKLYAFADILSGNGSNHSNTVKMGCTLPSSSSIEFTDTILTLLQEQEIIDVELDFVIYPNPAGNSFEIEIKGDYNSTSKIEIYNHLGQLLQIQSTGIEQINNFDAQTWPYGLYIIRLIDNKGNVVSKKLIKE
jgi:hypothetical protein